MNVFFFFSPNFLEIEMPTIIILASMELRGFGIDTAALQELCGAIKDDLSRVEEEAFGLAGRKFNFYSSKEVSQVSYFPNNSDFLLLKA